MFISLKITILSEMKDKANSIINWELHQKLSTKRKIDTEYKYKKPNGKKPGWFKRFVSNIKKTVQGLNEMLRNGYSSRN